MAGINGDDGNNTLNGGSGDDTISGQGGNGTIYGGDGNDTIITCDNGETTRLVGVDMDELEPRNFSTEAGPVCLHADTRVLTPGGWVPVQSLGPGDVITTVDRGPERIEDVCVQRLRFTNRFDRAKPVLIKKDSIGRGFPARDCIVSPQHRIAMPTLSGGIQLIAAVKL